jgi:hypothetical protein
MLARHSDGTGSRSNKFERIKFPLGSSVKNFCPRFDSAGVAISLFSTLPCFRPQTIFHCAHVILEIGHARTVR